ncbi:hypothetical protein HDU93_003425 [Gonapodya sp. JEL0774]|nr:hypothetical protein HDU93_003425 [Gonapodya sp. JEL0774]
MESEASAKVIKNIEEGSRGEGFVPHALKPTHTFSQERQSSSEKTQDLNVQQLRAVANALYSAGVKVADIAKASQVSIRTIHRWIKLSTTKPKKISGRKRKLSSIQEWALVAWLEAENGRTQADGVEMVKRKYGLSITQQSVSNIVRRVERKRKEQL